MRKLFRGLLITLALLLTGVAVGVVVLNYYLKSSQKELLAGLASTTGLDIAFRQMEVRAWSSFPRVSFAVDSLVVRDTLKAPTDPPLFATDRVTGELSLAALLRDTMELREVTLRGGGLYLERDSTGAFNAGNLFAESSAPGALPNAGDLLPVLDWGQVAVAIRDFGVTYRNVPRNKHIAARFDTLGVRVQRTAAGDPRLVGEFTSHFAEMAFNLDAGGYLTDTPVSGPVDITFGADRWTVPDTELSIGDQCFTAAASIERDTATVSHIYLTNDATDYDATFPILTRKLQQKMRDYYVDGPFPVRVHIASTFYQDKNPLVEIEFVLSGQAGRALQYEFSEAWMQGAFVNRLATRAGGTPGSRKNLRIQLDSIRLRQGSLDLRAPWAFVTANAYDTRLEAPLTISGPARAVSNRLGNRDFFFERGRFDLQTYINASLLSFEEIVTTSDARLQLTDLDVFYRPAGVRFPFTFIHLQKEDEDIRVQLQSKPLTSGFAFDLSGRIDNLTPLLIDLPGEAIRTDVTLHTARFDWTDFLALFGEEGYFDAPDGEAPANPVQSMKRTLLGLERTFQPRVRARLDTVGYYDVFTLYDFSTGLHFQRDSLVLEETTFNWQESEMAFSSRVHLGRPGETDFRLNAQTDHLDLNRLRGTLEYFGVTLPAGLDSLPTDLSIDFQHRGTIDDTLGIRPGSNAGTLVFDDGRHQLFSGEMQYAPGPEGLRTHIQLVGDPLIVNQLFGAENFFFGTGQFNLELELSRTPRDLPGLLAVGRLHLHIDDSRLQYRPQGVYIPVKSFMADMGGNIAEYELRLQNDSLQQELELRGRLDSLSAFLFPEAGRTFRVETEARASYLDWANLAQFMQSPQPDTTAFELQDLVSATSGIFTTFRPDVNLAIDTLQLDRHTELHDFFGGLSMQDSTVLQLERSGFTFGEGRIHLDATYALDDRSVSPFRIRWQVDSLSLGRLLDEVQAHDLLAVLDTGELSARLDLSGWITGQLNEDELRLLADSIQGKISYRLSETALADWPQLQKIGKKALMRKRFAEPVFAPIAGELSVADGRIDIPRTEIQSTALQVFIEGHYELGEGPDLLISVPLRNIGRGRLEAPPPPTGYAHAGWKVYLVMEVDEAGKPATRFRLGRRKYYRERGRLDELRELRRSTRALKRRAKK